jgi:hypothetical protein
MRKIKRQEEFERELQQRARNKALRQEAERQSAKDPPIRKRDYQSVSLLL